MGIFQFLGVKKKELTLDQVKREEIKLGIRESQTLAKLEKLEKGIWAVPVGRLLV